MNKEWKKQKSLLEGKVPGCSCSKLMILLENIIFSGIFYAKTLPPMAGKMYGAFAVFLQKMSAHWILCLL